MTLATDRRLTLTEYLHHSDGTNRRYELLDGVLKPMSLGTGRHGSIIKYLAEKFDQEAQRINLKALAIQGAVGIQSPRGTRWETCRIPDITVLAADLWAEMQDREAIIRLNDAPPPYLVVEVVSPSTRSEDYRSKHSEYAVLDIPEYWIVDPERQLVTVCTLIDGRYQDQEFRGAEPIISPTFAELSLTASQILTPTP